jgi:hypothetical protein
MATQFANGKIVTDGLVLCLDAADLNSYPTTGTTWFDLAGSNNGTLTNGPTFNSTNGGSIVFDGTNDYIIINDTPSLRVGNGISVGGWFIINSSIANAPITFVSKGNLTSTNNAFSLFGYQSKLQWNIGNFVGFGKEWTPPTTWSYIVGVYDSVNVYIYLNGTLFHSGPHTGGTPLSDAAGVTIGCETESGVLNFFANMKVGSVQIHNRALSAQEVLQNYNAQKSRFGIY